MSFEAKILELGLSLPPKPAPAGSYVSAIRVGNLVYTAGAICMRDGAMTHTGQVGGPRSIEYGYEAAQVCTMNLLAAIKGETGSLDTITRFVSVAGFVNGVSGFAESPAVINGASDLILKIFGEAGRHVRAAVTVAGLPKDSTVEVQCIVEVAP